MLILSRPWDSQPPPGTGLNLSNPPAARITHFLPLNGDPRELVTGARLTYGSGGTNVATNRGIALQGSGSAARASIPIDLSPYTSATVSFWMYWDAYANDDKLAMEYGANYATNSGFLIDPNSGAPASGLFQAGVGSTGAPNAVSMARPSAAAWHHYAFLFDRTTGTGLSTAIYVDGALQSVSAAGTSNNTADNFGNNNLYLLSRAGTSLYGAGKLQNLAIRGGYLMTVAEVLQEYQEPWQLFEPQSKFVIPASAAAPAGSTITTAQLPAGLGYMGGGQSKSILPAGLGYMG